MSITDRVRVSIAEEPSFGVPSTGTYTDLWITGESLKLETQSIASNEIRPDRMIVEHVRSSIRAAGAVNFELSYGSYDMLFEAALFSSGWSTPPANVSGTTLAFTDLGAGLMALADSNTGLGGIVVNSWIEINGAAAAGNNGIFKVTFVSAGAINYLNPNGVTASAGATVTVRSGAQIVNGLESRSFAIIREYTDLANQLVLFNGLEIDKMNLNITAEQLITGSLEFMGKNEESLSSTIASGYTAVNSNQILNAIDHIDGVMQGAEHSSIKITSVTLAIDNNLRQRSVVGEVGPESFGAGKTVVTGTVNMFLSSSTLIDLYLSWTATSLAFKVVDNSGNTYVFELPQIKFTRGERVAGGVNQDIIASFDWSCERKASEDVMIRIVRFAAL